MRSLRLASVIFVASFCLVFHGLNRQSSLNLFETHKQSIEINPKIAICLVGGARAFELTGPSLVEQVLDVYGGTSDVFLHSPLDKNTYKLFLLGSSSMNSSSSSRLASARIFEPKLIPELDSRKQVLTSAGSVKGIQGLLQYFYLVQGCWDLITEHETHHGFHYDWIIRTRLDGYWTAPMPRISAFRRGIYTVPHGSQFGGLNDRLGIGDRNSSHTALHRLQSLESLQQHGYHGLNSEQAFKAQLQIASTSFQLEDFHFCVVSRKKYDWPPREWGVPVMAMPSKGWRRPLNGAKCRPCREKVGGVVARDIVEAINREWGWSGTSEEVELCDARRDWDVDWEMVFDAGADERGRRERVKVSAMGSVDECVERVSDFAEMWENWDAPAANAICRRRFVS